MHEGDFLEDLVKGIGDRVRMARLAKGLSQAELSEAIDMSPSFISHIETGKQGMNVRAFASVCKVLDVSADWLLGIESPSSQAIDHDMLAKAIEEFSPKERTSVLHIVHTVQEMLKDIKLQQGE